MKTMLIGATLILATLTISVTIGAATRDARATPAAAAAGIPNPDGLAADVVIGDRFVVPALPEAVVTDLPAAAARGDRYLAERVAVAELIIGDRIPMAERQAAIYADTLPGFADVLVADGFRRNPDGTWTYDRFASWMRYALNR